MLVAGENPVHRGMQSRSGLWDEPVPRFVTTLSLVIEKLVARCDQVERSSKVARTEKRMNVFHGVRPPTITIAKYLERMYKYTSCSPSCFVVCYVYLDRMMHKHPSFLVVSLNVHRLLVTSIMIASKMLDDMHYNNAFFARVGGISNSELNRLELEFLFLLDFGVAVTDPDFQTYTTHLERTMLVNDALSTVERAPTQYPTMNALLDPVSQLHLYHRMEQKTVETSTKPSSASAEPKQEKRR